MLGITLRKKIPYQIIDRRPCDIEICLADPSLAEKIIGWKAEYHLNEMIEDAWRWQSKNPKGYNRK